MKTLEMKCLPAGDKALVVEFGTVIDETINNAVHSLAAWLEAQSIAGIVELLPTFRSLMIYYEPALLSSERLQSIVKKFPMDEVGAMGAVKRILKVPCCYSTQFGLDLLDMCKLTGFTREELVQLHSGVDYKIYMLGFLPGFVYLGGLDSRLEAPRLSTPRVRINPGSVGIGGNQTGVYPIASPGGWRLIGGTPLEFYNPNSENPILCKAGEYIRFVPITTEEYYDIRQMIMKGKYVPEIITQEG